MEKNIQQYEFNLEKKSYRLRTSIINDNLIQIICTPKNQTYGYINTFSQNDLIKINNIFSNYNNIKEIQNAFEKCILTQKVSLFQNRTLFNIIFYLPVIKNKKEEKIVIKLIYENEYDNKYKININYNEIKPIINNNNKKKNKYILNKLEKDIMNMALHQEIMNNKIKEVLNSETGYINNYNDNNNTKGPKNNNKIKESKNHNTLNNNIISSNTKIYLNGRKLKYFIDSSILKTPEEYNLLNNKLLSLKNIKISKNINYKLLFKSTQDSDKAQIFHQKCDKINNTLILILTDNGKKFGGFTTQTWEGQSINKKDDNAFIFSLDKLKIYDIIKGENAITCNNELGPIFCGFQILIYNNFFKKGGITEKAHLNYNTEEDYELNGGNSNFGINELEVFEIIFD